MRLLDIFSKIFRKKEKVQQSPQLLLGNLTTEPKMKRFDIVIFTEDEGREQQRTENGVYGQSAQQLIALYAATGEKIKILREYEDASTEKKPIEVVPQNMKVEQTKSIPVEQPKNETPIPPSVKSHSSPTVSQYVAPSKKMPAKYFTICGTECKLEDGKIYQKQWVKILGNEASQYRLISDSNNKEISLTGKHLEMLKWVMVQDESDNLENNLNTSIMQILNG